MELACSLARVARNRSALESWTFSRASWVEPSIGCQAQASDSLWFLKKQPRSRYKRKLSAWANKITSGCPYIQSGISSVHTNRTPMKIPTILLATALCVAGAPTSKKPTSIEWQPWSDAIFDQAKRENKFVLLDLEAVWCHWCHVMDETTYKTPEVIALIQSKYIPVRVDQDSRPDLSNRYEDYGWPATVVFSPTGSEIVKRQGYLEPRQMTSMLKAIIADPSPGPSV